MHKTYTSIKSFKTTIERLKKLVDNQEKKLLRRALNKSWGIVNDYPNKWDYVNYSSCFDKYGSDRDLIPTLEVSIDYDVDFVKASTYSFGLKRFVPLFTFPVTFLWDAK